MSNISRIYASDRYRTPIRYNDVVNHFELPVIWGGDQKRSYFPDGYDAVYKVKGVRTTNEYIRGDAWITADVSAGTTKLTGDLTSPQYFASIWLPESSATKWTKGTKFPVNECQTKIDAGKEGGSLISIPRIASYAHILSPKIDDVRTWTGPIYKIVNGKIEGVDVPGHYNFHSPGITYVGRYSHPGEAEVMWGDLKKLPWGFVPAFDSCGMGYPSTVDMNDREITIRFDTLFSIPVADTKFHFVAFYKSGQKSDFYTQHRPTAGYKEKHIKYLYQGSNITSASIKNSQSTNSGIRYIGTKGSGNIYHFWSTVTAKKGTHGFFTPIGIGFSGNVNNHNAFEFYDNAVSFRIRP